MGHQFFQRLSGDSMCVLQHELALDLPDLDRAADAAVKVVYHRVLALYAAGDLHRICAALVPLPGDAAGSNAPHVLMRAVATGFLDRLASTCVYRDDAQRIALAMLRAGIVMGATKASVANNLEQAFKMAARFCAEQVSRSETVFRIPRAGLLSARDTTRDLTYRMQESAGRALIRHFRRDPTGWRKNKWHAPRRKAPKASASVMRDGNVGT